jgi:hypothetical protein
VDGPSPWPLWVERRNGGGERALRQRAGDAIVYLGIELTHRRDRIPRGDTSSALLVHYVRRDFVGRLY